MKQALIDMVDEVPFAQVASNHSVIILRSSMPSTLASVKLPASSGTTPCGPPQKGPGAPPLHRRPWQADGGHGREESASLRRAVNGRSWNMAHTGGIEHGIDHG